MQYLHPQVLNDLIMFVESPPMAAHNLFDKLSNISHIWKLCPESSVASTASFVEHVLPSVVDVASQEGGNAGRESSVDLSWIGHQKTSEFAP